MVGVADIADGESLKRWLEGQPPDASVWIAARIAARSLPFHWSNTRNQSGVSASAEMTIASLRYLLTSLVAGGAQDVTTSLVAAVGETASEATEGFVLHSGMADAALAMENGDAGALLSDATNAAGAAIHAAAKVSARLSVIGSGPDASNVDEALAQAQKAIVYKAYADAVNGTGDMSTQDRWARANPAADAVKGELWRSVRRDTEAAESGTLPDALALWQDGSNPLADQWTSLRGSPGAGQDAAGDWAFWIAWYDALLEGRPMLGDAARTLEMLERIALIDSEIWKNGPEAVNPEIREIWELYRLRVEVAELQAEMAALSSDRASKAQRGHNQPPEGLVDTEQELGTKIKIIWDVLNEAQDELEKDRPDKSRLWHIGEKMQAALEEVVAYSGKVADAFVMSAAKVGGGTVGTSILDHFANDGRLMQFANDLLTYSLGG